MSPDVVLRPYQSAAVSEVLANVAFSPILVAPTGSGKTVMGRSIVAGVGGRVLWIAHRKELIEQAASHLSTVGSVGIIRSGVTPAPLARIQVASRDTLAVRQYPEANVVIVDEAHHAASGGRYQRILSRYSYATRIGLTATPFRLDGRGLGCELDDGRPMFGKIVVAAYTEDLVRDGYLHAPKVYAGRAPDLRGLKVKRGDFEVGELAGRYGDEEQADIVKTWTMRAGGKRTLAFAVNIEHSRRIVNAFTEVGIPAVHLDGSTPEAEREQSLSDLQAGRISIVSNVGLFLEGLDIPAIECVIMARPTASLCVHLQTIGRVMRICDGKSTPIVLDHAGNHHVHGLVTRRLRYSLEGGKVAGESDPLGLKRCPQCFLMCDTTARECPECDHVFSTKQVDVPGVTGTAELQEYEGDFAYKQQFWSLVESQRQAWGYKPGWSLFRYKEQFGEWPVVVDGELVDPDDAGIDQKRAVYTQLLKTARLKGFRDGWASHQFKERFGTWPSGFVTQVKAELGGCTEADAARQKWEEWVRS